MGITDIHSLWYTKWHFKYHIVFAPKYRRKICFTIKNKAIVKILRKLREWKRVNI